jgi:hypothetical protein
MTNPNLTNIYSFYMKSAIQSIATGLNDIVSNPSGSNKIFRVETVTICNTTASAISVDTYLTRSATTYAIAKTIEVPAYSSLVVVDKDYPIYLEEGDAIQLLASDLGLQAVCAYTTLSDFVPQLTTSNLLLYLDAADTNSYPGTGTTWFDLSGNNFHGTLTNGPVWNGTYFEFDGDNDYVEMGTIPVDHPLQLNAPTGGGITIMFASWVNAGGDTYPRIVDKSDAGLAANGWAIFPNNGGAGNPLLFASSGAGGWTASSTAATAATWQIFTFTWDVSTGSAEWYLNGVPELGTASRFYDIPNVQTNMRLGTWNHTDARELNGRIGFFMVYDRVLSSSEIAGNFEFLRNNYGI